MLRSAVLALAVLAACRPDHGPPQVKKLPRPDNTPALRGGGAPRSPRIASYKIDARLDGTRHTIQATETLIWTNAGQSAVDRLPFHLYLNAFKNESSLFMRTSKGRMRLAKASDTGWGWINIESVSVGGAELVSKLEFPGKPDETVVELPLPAPVQPGSTIEVAFQFTAQLPEVFARTGYKGDFHLVAQWFPKIGVRVGPPGAEHWECEPHHAFSEFFADFGNYDVTLTVPSTHIVAATGVLKEASTQPGQTRKYTYHAEDVHDFVWMADPYMVVDNTGRSPFIGKAKVEDGEVEVRVYARKEQSDFARRHLAAAIGAIEKFSAAYVPYPWAIITIIDPPMEAALGAGGMEYPTLVTTLGDSVISRPNLRLPEMVTIHEVGHNWFQGMLASNEPIEAWLDEGVDEWAETHVLQELYGVRTSLVDWMGWQGEYGALRSAYVALRKAYRDDPSRLPSPIAAAAAAFVDSDAYYEATYDATRRALATLEAHVGSAKFLAAMKVYAKEFAFKHPTGRDLYATLERELGVDLGWYFAPVFQQVGGMALSVRSAECRAAHPPRGIFGDGSYRKVFTETEAGDTGTYVCEVVVQNMGVVHVPVEIQLEFADGSNQRVQWDDRGGASWQRFVVERSSKLVAVYIDPDRKLALEVPTAHHVRLDGDGTASLRASARVASWAQALMQVVGP